jgi:hypothetical protein
MGLLGKLIAGKVMAKAVQKVKQKNAAQAAPPAPQGQYIPAGAGVMPAARPGLANMAVDFYEKNPKLVAGAATLIMAALAASLSKGRKLR